MFLLIAKSIIVPILLSFAVSVFAAFKTLLYLSVEQAEKQWAASGTGDQKRAYVVNTAVAFINKQHPLGWLQRWALTTVLNCAVDMIIDKLNAQMGHDWNQIIAGIQTFCSGIKLANGVTI